VTGRKEVGPSRGVAGESQGAPYTSEASGKTACDRLPAASHPTEQEQKKRWRDAGQDKREGMIRG